MKSSLVVTTLVLALAHGSTAHADWPEGKPYVGVFGGYHVVTRDWDLGDHFYDATRIQPESSPTVGLRLGYQILRNLAFEVNGSWLPITPSVGSDQSLIEVDGAVLYHLTRGAFAPFLEAGGGVYIARGGALATTRIRCCTPGSACAVCWHPGWRCGRRPAT